MNTTIIINILSFHDSNLRCFFAGAASALRRAAYKNTACLHEMEMYWPHSFGVDYLYAIKMGISGDESRPLVNPVDLIAMQIVSAAKAGGFKGVSIVASTMTGFACGQPGPPNIISVKSPWKKRQGRYW